VWGGPYAHADDRGRWPHLPACFPHRPGYAPAQDAKRQIDLRSVTPETIARKDRLVADVEAMLADPRPHESDWRDALRAAIDDLDALERPFAPLDEYRFGKRPTRRRLIDDPRERWPWLAA
jgi:hypothetical protein